MTTRPRARLLRTTVVMLSTACALEGTEEPPMDVSAFDPSQSLAAARAFAGEKSELLGFEARFVRADGTMDLTADYHPTLEYEFIRKNPEPNAAPVGSGVQDRAYEVIEIEVREPRWVNVKRYGGGCSGTFHDLGMQRDVRYTNQREFHQRTAAPTCSLAQVWSAARRQKTIPEGAVAIIEFNGAGYEFAISDLDVELWFTPDCEPLEESAYDAREADLRLSPDDRARRDRERAEAAQHAAEEEATRAEREAARDAQFEQARREALERIRAAKAQRR